MRQIWISKAGPPEVLVVKEAPDPQPAPDEVRVRVEASGVNFADVMGRLGLYPDLPPIPVVPGYEVAGRVDAVGEGVDPSWVGRDVFALTRFGGYCRCRLRAPRAGLYATSKHVRPRRRVDSGKLRHRLAAYSRHGRIEARRNRPHSFRRRRRWHRRDPDRQAHRREGHRNRVGRQARRTARTRRRSLNRLQDRGFRNSGARDNKRTRSRTHPRRRGRGFAQEGLPAACAYRSAGRLRRVVSSDEQDRREVWSGFYARQHALASVQSAVPDERKQGCLRRQPGTHVGRSRPDARAGWIS